MLANTLTAVFIINRTISLDVIIANRFTTFAVHLFFKASPAGIIPNVTIISMTTGTWSLACLATCTTYSIGAWIRLPTIILAQGAIITTFPTCCGVFAISLLELSCTSFNSDNVKIDGRENTNDQWAKQTYSSVWVRTRVISCCSKFVSFATTFLQSLLT